MWSRRNSVCSESRPKAFDMSSGIPKLPITSRSVDNIYNRVLCCKSISINYKMHGWFLYWQHATGWVRWKSGLRAVAMWSSSSSSFTKSLFWKQIFGLQPISDLNAQFAVCDYLHNVSHIIWLIMNRNRKACLAYVNNVCLRMLGCVHCARLCVSARLCAFLLGCVLCLARLVLVIDGRTVSTWLR